MKNIARKTVLTLLALTATSIALAGGASVGGLERSVNSSTTTVQGTGK
ncbi:hypothetical protein MF271_02120 (plasmid) [Deinococcus sp. KNUC1210]|nr:hypothetical protein [Deinococcus sp. KNUC1210]ULH14098.1 hypothetical protein MF271_02120 [Deinococcus sp. KNUC1210]